MAHQIKEQVVLVTGAGRRVGHHMAQRLHQAGYHVVAHYRTQTAEIQALQEMGVDTVQADLDTAEHIMAFAEDLSDRYVTFRALIHNASSFKATDDDSMIAAAQYQQFFAIHMLAPYLINQRLHQQLINHDDSPADIIHITDINVENPTPQFDIYGTTKAGLHNLTLALAKKWGPKIKVNAVAPGPVLFTPQHTDETIEQMLSETPLAREGGAEPVYLAVQSILNNPFLTGCSIPVDGGRRLSKR